MTKREEKKSVFVEVSYNSVPEIVLEPMFFVENDEREKNARRYNELLGHRRSL